MSLLARLRGVTTRISEPAFDRFKRKLANDRFGILGRQVAEAARRNAPVRRGHRSFDTSPGPLGGTLRDGITYLVAVEGEVVYAPASPNGPTLEVTADARAAIEGGRDKVEVVIGTTTSETVNPLNGDARDYGYWVHEGTSRMPGRPFLVEGLNETDVEAAVNP